MRTLILSDAAAGRLLAVLDSSEEGRSVRAEFSLPEPTEEDLYGGLRSDRAPASIALRRERLDSVQSTLELCREDLKTTILMAVALRIPIAKLSRWSGYSRATIHALINERSSNEGT